MEHHPTAPHGAVAHGTPGQGAAALEAALDDPVWAALSGPHAHLAEGAGAGRRYPADVSPFCGLADHDDERAWRDLAALAGAGSTLLVPALAGTPPRGFAVTGVLPGVQLVATPALRTADLAAVPGGVELGEEDVPQMLDLVERTQPGPFLPRTRLLGRYVGVREGGRLLAMAGERLRTGAATEISAVCTDPAARGRGLATALVRAVAHGIAARGELPFLHATATNAPAIRLYEAMGFRLRREVGFARVRLPG
ncbi:GNAT family N-acetyltransferase [Kineococcus sp. T13]|nr:GNAT family N-acetyltransferase [Kineococcus vitellinus]